MFFIFFLFERSEKGCGKHLPERVKLIFHYEKKIGYQKGEKYGKSKTGYERW